MRMPAQIQIHARVSQLLQLPRLMIDHDNRFALVQPFYKLRRRRAHDPRLFLRTVILPADYIKSLINQNALIPQQHDTGAL